MVKAKLQNKNDDFKDETNAISMQKTATSSYVYEGD